MKTSSSINEFHRWLHVKTDHPGEACSVLLHGNSSLVDDALVEKIAAYLNEYDGEGDGRWLAATESLVKAIAEDSFLRQLIGLEYELPADQDASTIQSRAFAAMSRRGHMIGRPPVTDLHDHAASRYFKVGVGDMEPRLCHMVLNPDKISDQDLAPIIGDVFLEWLHVRQTRGLSA